jgi:uncharacterized protein YidB (DUF937 family)
MSTILPAAVAAMAPAGRSPQVKSALARIEGQTWCPSQQDSFCRSRD